MPPSYDLILQSQRQSQIETVHVPDAAEAWRFGREHYPNAISGVVFRDGTAAHPIKRR